VIENQFFFVKIFPPLVKAKNHLKCCKLLLFLKKASVDGEKWREKNVHKMQFLQEIQLLPFFTVFAILPQTLI
jgi:hypothetical protein